MENSLLQNLLVLAHFAILLKFQIQRRRNRINSRPLAQNIRNIYFEYKLREQFGPSIRPFVYQSSVLSYIDETIANRLTSGIQDQIDSKHERRIHLEQPLDLYEPIDPENIPDLRLPKPGIKILPYRYFQKSPGLGFIEAQEQTLTQDPSLPEDPLDRKPETYSVDIDLSGYPPHPDITRIIEHYFPEYVIYLREYCRPYSFGPQAFYDFNRTTQEHARPTPERENDILELMQHVMQIRPYTPLHMADTLATHIPLGTSASYNMKYDPKNQVYSSISSPSLYAERPTSKGHHINTTLNYARQVIHNIKNYETPQTDSIADCLQEDSSESERLQMFFRSEPTELFIRTQISKRDPTENKKIRPVYAVSFLFILIELMITYCLIIQLRNPECAVLHGLETFRGGMQHINFLAHSYSAYMSLDWSQFDQRLPLYVVIAYFTRWIPAFIIINKGYTPTHTYPDSSKHHATPFAIKIFNLLNFLLLWYINMVFISYDGYAYVRLNGGVPSGLYNTQSLDSFGNMYIISDCLLEFGFSLQDCKNMLFFILGDDNIIFARENFNVICDFMQFLDSYAKTRHGMVLSILKSTYTFLRSKIEVLGYTNSNGMPTRPIGKLVAQLAFPERPVKHDWHHAARAIGLAYASCGQSAPFHMLCYFVYKQFRPDHPVPTAQIRRILKHTISDIKGFELEDEMFTFPDFPTLHDASEQVSNYKGAFNAHDKWNTNIFSASPLNQDPDIQTLAQWLTEHPEYQFSTNNIMHGYSSPN